MDLKVKHITWVGNIYRKIEAVCKEVDDVVGQDALKYLENRVQNVGDSVKKFYSDIVQELLPLPSLVDSEKHEAHSVALKNNVDSSVKSIVVVKDNNKNGAEENPVNNFIESLQDSNVIDLANDQQAHGLIKYDLVNHVSDETSSNSLEVEDSYITQEEVGDDHSRETSGATTENLDAIIEKIAMESRPQLLSFVTFKVKYPLELSKRSESFPGSSDSGCGALAGTKDNVDVNAEQNSRLIVEENAMNSSTSQVLNFMSLGEKESFEASIFSELSDDIDEDTYVMLAEVSPATSTVPCERPTMKKEPFCFKSSLISDSLYSKSPGSYSFEIESCKSNSVDDTWCISDSSMVLVCCEPTPLVSGPISESQDGIVSSGSSQSMESNDESLVNSIESSIADIQLSDDAKLEESCVFVDDRELYAVSCRAQKLRSYKKRIRHAFALKKRLAKEYEQLAIWYGDTNTQPSQGLSQTLLPFSSRTSMNSKNLQVQHASETEWELL